MFVIRMFVIRFFPQSFHRGKLDEITVFYALQALRIRLMHIMTLLKFLADFMTNVSQKRKLK